MQSDIIQSIQDYVKTLNDHPEQLRNAIIMETEKADNFTLPNAFTHLTKWLGEEIYAKGKEDIEEIKVINSFFDYSLSFGIGVSAKINNESKIKPSMKRFIHRLLLNIKSKDRQIESLERQLKQQRESDFNLQQRVTKWLYSDAISEDLKLAFEESFPMEARDTEEDD